MIAWKFLSLIDANQKKFEKPKLMKHRPLVVQMLCWPQQQPERHRLMTTQALGFWLQEVWLLTPSLLPRRCWLGLLPAHRARGSSTSAAPGGGMHSTSAHTAMVGQQMHSLNPPCVRSEQKPSGCDICRTHAAQGCCTAAVNPPGRGLIGTPSARRQRHCGDMQPEPSWVPWSGRCHHRLRPAPALASLPQQRTQGTPSSPLQFWPCWALQSPCAPCQKESQTFRRTFTRQPAQP